MGLDAIISLGGLIIPPVFDFIKKKFLKPGTDSPESTISSLATTKPDALPAYVTALATYTNAQVAWYNRDVVGELWAVTTNIRALIRPCSVVLFGIHLFLAHTGWIGPLDEGTRYFYEANISSWFGSKLNKE